MKKSILVAKCLVKASIADSTDGGLAIFYTVWDEFFQAKNLAQWDSHVPQWLEQRFLERAKESTKINVKSLIEDLTESAG